MFQAFEVKSAKGVKRGKISVVDTEKGTVCVVEWIGGGFMFFTGPAMIIFRTGQNELIVEFTGTSCKIGPCCKPIKNAIIDDSAAYFTVLHNTGFRMAGDVTVDDIFLTSLMNIDKNGLPTLMHFGKVSWSRIRSAQPTYSAFEDNRLNRY